MNHAHTTKRPPVGGRSQVLGGTLIGPRSSDSPWGTSLGLSAIQQQQQGGAYGHTRKG